MKIKFFNGDYYMAQGWYIVEETTIAGTTTSCDSVLEGPFAEESEAQRWMKNNKGRLQSLAKGVTLEDLKTKVFYAGMIH